VLVLRILETKIYAVLVFVLSSLKPNKSFGNIQTKSFYGKPIKLKRPFKYTHVIIITNFKPTRTKPQIVKKELQKMFEKWHLCWLVVLNKTVVQQHSVETLHNNRNSLKQKRNLANVT